MGCQPESQPSLSTLEASQVTCKYMEPGQRNGEGSGDNVQNQEGPGLGGSQELLAVPQHFSQNPAGLRASCEQVTVDPVKLHQSIRTVLFNQCMISFPMVVFLYPFLKWWGDPCRRELPTFHWFLLELAIFTLIEEVLFYYSHRLLHHPTFYKKIHKKHHEWTAPIGIISLYAHPIEHVVSNMLPAIVGPLVMGSHLSSITTWFSLALIITTISHCGYHLPFLPSPEFHDYHHRKFNQCYGVLGVLDHLHGTDTMFKQTKAYERHVLLLGFTPLSESIPESPKKME
ncbi:Fatty acid hydroxylase domain-containing protein 2 [Saguinus oedipus]|uniref:Fatty acid hydroxylase domain-containing protein 2 n=1 Tax=Saguinus oedipus TaxID=9490 RepID=A0ABQ9W4M8_SAGOE|nr:Fatty acid hydroxylase domain-containing protein 2 [Saguinus oedipus]